MDFSYSSGDGDIVTVRAFAVERACDIVRACVPPEALNDKGAAGEIVLDLADKFASFILSGSRSPSAS